MTRRLGKAGKATVAAVASVTAMLALSACGGSDATAWANDVCGKIKPSVQKLTTPPELAQGDPAKTKEALSTFVTDASSATDSIVTAMKDAGDPPVDGGAEAVEKMSDAMATVKAALGRAKQEIDKADPSDPAAFQAAFTKAGKEMAALGKLTNPISDLKAGEEMNAAFREAENCKSFA